MAYSPDIKIYIKTQDQVIRLADLLDTQGKLYSNDFQTINKGTEADLILSIDGKEQVRRIRLRHNIKASDRLVFWDYINNKKGE